MQYLINKLQCKNELCVSRIHNCKLTFADPCIFCLLPVPVLGLMGGGLQMCCDWAHMGPLLLLINLSDGRKEHKCLDYGQLEGPVA